MLHRQRFESDEERFYLAWNIGKGYTKDQRKHTHYWRRRTVIFHYSNGTNKCAVEGCDAPVDALTIEHDHFNGEELAKSLGYAITTTHGTGLVDMLFNKGFPDLPISIKCMAHNTANAHPNHAVYVSKALSKNRDHITITGKVCNKCGVYKTSDHFTLFRRKLGGIHNTCKECDNIRRKMQNNQTVIRAFQLYGYFDVIEHMTWEHSHKDGALHRLYLSIKYSLKSNIGSKAFASLVLRESEKDLPNWPGLVIMHHNDNHLSAKAMNVAKYKVDYFLFWTEDKYKPFRDSLTDEQKERMKNEQQT